MLLRDGVLKSTTCNRLCHLSCCDPPLSRIPEGKCYCSECEQRHSSARHVPEAGERFTCGCGREFKKSMPLKLHQLYCETSPKRRPYQTCVCGREFKCQAGLKLHLPYCKLASAQMSTAMAQTPTKAEPMDEDDMD